ncbi:MAG: rhodanese-like domain-containing protein [Gammaproteobacteria bacterium]|nr:rhodanese-like domain-containing protein [Gammaproteobacteria bacterium]
MVTSTRAFSITPFIIGFAFLLQLLFGTSAHATEITSQQLLKLMETNTAPMVLDVRRPDEYVTGHVPKAINIPHTELEKRIDEIRDNMDKEIIVYCESGRRAGIAMDILKQAGFTKILHLEGDMKVWRTLGLPADKAVNPVMP